MTDETTGTAGEPTMDSLIRWAASRGEITFGAGQEPVDRPRDEHGRFTTAEPPAAAAATMDAQIRGWGSSARDAAAAAAGEQPKTFSQVDVDRIVGDRLASEQAEYEDLKAKAARLDELESAAAAGGQS
jgi:hypothetical protein